MADKLVFYTNPMSRGRIVRWMLEEVDTDYEQVVVEYGPKMKSGDYQAINPMGKVPAIKHGESIVTECAAICTYLADAFPKAELAPPNDQRAEYYRWLFFAAGPLEAAVLNNSFGIKLDDDQQLTSGYGNYELILSVLDQFLEKSEYVCGNKFTAADVYLGSHVNWGLMFNTIKPTDNFQAYSDRLRERPAYKKAKQIDDDLMPK